MSKLGNGYPAEWISAEDASGKQMDFEGIGQQGLLTVWESEHSHPGKRYVRFAADDGSYLVTSCGELEVSDDRLVLSTHGGAHLYTFRLTGGAMKMPERYWHICDTCGKRELLSGREAFQQGWEYPGPDGTYRGGRMCGFSRNVPRICKRCAHSGRMDGWLQYYGGLALMAGEEESEADTIRALGEAQEAIDWMEKTKEERGKRVFQEPWSLLPEEDG